VSRGGHQRYAPSLRDENLGNFHARLIAAGEQNSFHVKAWGCISILVIRFS